MIKWRWVTRLPPMIKIKIKAKTKMTTRQRCWRAFSASRCSWTTCRMVMMMMMSGTMNPVAGCLGEC